MSGGWPVNHVGLDIGKGNLGTPRGSPNGQARRRMISVRFTDAEAGELLMLADERGHTVGRTVRDLVTEAMRGGGGKTSRGPSGKCERCKAELKALSEPGNEPQRPPEKLRPVHEFGTFAR